MMGGAGAGVGVGAGVIEGTGADWPIRATSTVPRGQDPPGR